MKEEIWGLETGINLNKIRTVEGKKRNRKKDNGKNDELQCTETISLKDSMSKEKERKMKRQERKKEKDTSRTDKSGRSNRNLNVWNKARNGIS